MKYLPWRSQGNEVMVVGSEALTCEEASLKQCEDQLMMRKAVDDVLIINDVLIFSYFCRHVE